MAACAATWIATGAGSLGRMTVLAPKVDPFRQDTEAGHRDGSWFAAFVERLGLHGEIHLRGVHYAGRDEEEVHKPDGTLYLGTDEDWNWLQGTAAKAARWLSYSDSEQIVDKRNDVPIAAPYDERGARARAVPRRDRRA